MTQSSQASQEPVETGVTQSSPQNGAAPATPEDIPGPLAASQLVPVSESIRYRRRAQQAERRLAELQQQLVEQHRARSAAEADLAAARQRTELTRMLAARGVVDLDAAILLAEQRLAETASADSPAELAGTIEQLLKDKPYLTTPWGEKPAGDSPAGEPASQPPAPEDKPDAAATQAGPVPAASADTPSAAPAEPKPPVAPLPAPTLGRRGPAGPAELLRTAARKAAASGRGVALDHYLKVRRQFK